jgi:hypothetical protein
MSVDDLTNASKVLRDTFYYTSLTVSVTRDFNMTCYLSVRGFL